MPLKRHRSRARRLGRIAASTATFGLRRLVRRGPDDASAFGDALVAELDQLKGMAMKVGQILSYMDGALPEDTQRALAVLQRGKAPVPWETIRAAIEAGLGASVEASFDSIDPTPIAAASIGQVHRASLGGRDLVVKVQYPDVRGTFDADIGHLRRIAALASAFSHVDGQALVDELRDRLHEGCDYAHEARWQRAFSTALADWPEVVIPEVVAERSSTTVLTSEWCEGAILEDFVAQASQSERDAAGRTLLRVAWHSTFALAAINADPHPGNQLFRPGQVVLLDFGCVRTFQEDWLDGLRREVRAILDGDRAAARDAVIAQGMVPRPERFDFDDYWAIQQFLWRPYLKDKFAFGPELVRDFRRFNGMSNPSMRQLAIPPPWIWLTRLQWGLHAVLARLRVTLEAREELERALAQPRRPLRPVG